MAAAAGAAATPENLTAPGAAFRHKASSVLNKSAEFASKHMFDGSVETCWNSDQGSPQFVSFDFEPSRVLLSEVRLMFQGGFVGQDAVIEVGEDNVASLRPISKLELIEDCNRLQSFSLNASSQQQQQPATGSRFVRITFPSSTDFYGRITVYRLELWGTRL